MMAPQWRHCSVIKAFCSVSSTMSASKSRAPTENELVSRALLTFDRREGDTEYWECKNCEKKDVIRRQKAGWTNTMAHLSSASCYGNKDRVVEVYNRALAERNKRGGSITQFVDIQSLNQRQLDMYAWIRLIVMKSLRFGTSERLWKP